MDTCTGNPLEHRGSHLGADIGRLIVAFGLILASCGGGATSEPPEQSAAETTSAAATTSPSEPAAETTSTAASAGATTPTTSAVTTSSSAESTDYTTVEEEGYTASLVSSEGYTFPHPPEFPEGGISAQLRHDLNAFFDILESERRFAHMELLSFTNHDDIRVAWVLTDILRFANSLELIEVIGARLQEMLGAEGLAGDPIDLWKRGHQPSYRLGPPRLPGLPEIQEAHLRARGTRLGALLQRPGRNDRLAVGELGGSLHRRPAPRLDRPLPMHPLPG